MVVDLININIEDLRIMKLNIVKSKPFFDKSKWYESMVKCLLIEFGYKHESAIRWWVTNTVRVVKSRGTGMTVKLKTSYYKGNKCKLTASKIRAFLYELERNQYIDIYKGYKILHGARKGEGESTIVVYLDKTLDMVGALNYPLNFKASLLDDVVVVKSRDTGERKDLRNFPNIKNVRSQVEKYNNYLGTKSIKFNGKEVAVVEYKRSFTDNSEQGGRLYINGGSVQLLPQEMRSKFLTIDDEDLVELDYSSNHPNMLYEIKNTSGGVDYDVKDFLGEGFKPYDCNTEFLNVDHSVVTDEHNPVRNLCKFALLVMLNSKGRNSAKLCINQEINNDRNKPLKDQKFHGIIGKISVEELLDSLCDHNALIEGHFYCDVGLKLQNIDSKIAMDVIDRMLQEDIPVLCWHDSFMCPLSEKEKLRCAMKEAWEFILSDNKFCYVDEK